MPSPLPPFLSSPPHTSKHPSPFLLCTPSSPISPSLPPQARLLSTNPSPIPCPLTSSFRKALKFLVTVFGSTASLPLTLGKVFKRSNASSEWNAVMTSVASRPYHRRSGWGGGSGIKGGLRARVMDGGGVKGWGGGWGGKKDRGTKKGGGRQNNGRSWSTHLSF